MFNNDGKKIVFTISETSLQLGNMHIMLILTIYW